MVRYEMAIYEYKEFLNIDDVAEYLTDKGVSDFYPLTTYSEKRFNDLLSEWIKLERLRPLFPFNEWVMQYKIDYGFEINKSNVIEFAENILDDFERIQNGGPKKHNHKGKRIDIGKKFINDYLIFDNSKWEELCKFEKSELGILDWNKFYNDENNKYQFDIIYCDDIPQEYRKFTILRNKVLFLKSELDTIFNPNQPTDLQQENERLQARIAELESQLASQPANATPANLTGLNKVNYDKQKAKQFAKIVAKSIWEMDSTKQIKTGDMVKFLLPLINEFDSQNLPDTDDSIREWIKDIRPNYAVTSGRPPNNAPKEIPLTFKK